MASSLSCAATIPFFFFFNDTATTEIYTLSLHDALPICHVADFARDVGRAAVDRAREHDTAADPGADREPHDVVRPARRAAPPLAEDRAVGVVVERRRLPERLRQPVAQRVVRPAQIRGKQDDA